MPDIQLDHLVLFVPKLERAMADFSSLGFTVIAGGQHASTENALIVFEDETYIELLALKPDWKRPVFRAARRCTGSRVPASWGVSDLRSSTRGGPQPGARESMGAKGCKSATKKKTFQAI